MNCRLRLLSPQCKHAVIAGLKSVVPRLSDAQTVYIAGIFVVHLYALFIKDG